MVLLVLQFTTVMYLKSDTDRETGHSRKISFSGFSMPRRCGAENFIFSFDSPFRDLQNYAIKSIKTGGWGSKKPKTDFWLIDNRSTSAYFCV